MSRVNRTNKEMAEALLKHMALLREYAEKCFIHGEANYAGEVAGKLRLLVTRFGSNRPLLLDLMNKFDSNIKVTLGGPPIKRPPGVPRAGDEITLEEYLQLDALGVRIPSGDFVMLTKVELIRAWAQQTGASHEDWTMEPELKSALDFPLQIMGLQATAAELRVTTETVIHVGDQFIDELQKGGILNV